MRRRYQEDPEFRRKHRERTERNNAKYKAKVAALIDEFKADGCSLCEETEACCLTAHHLDPEDKDFNIGDAVRRGISPKKTAKELSKCVCLCANCHAKVHAGVAHL
jgi:hypothetical protein